MDVNGTRLHLVLGLDDWQRSIVGPIDPDVCFDERRHTIGLRPRPFVFPTRSDVARLVPDDRRGADVDRFGNRYWIGDDRRSIRVLGAEGTEAFTWWPSSTGHERVAPDDVFVVCSPPSITVVELAALTITDDQYLVAGVHDFSDDAAAPSAGLLVFDLAGGGPPSVRNWPDELAVRPVDMAARPNGGVVVLDAPVGAAARLWYLDEHLRLVDLGSGSPAEGETPMFEPVESSVPGPPIATRETRDLERAVASCAVSVDVVAPVAVETLPDGTVLVLEPRGENGHPDVSRWRCGARIPFALRLATSGDDDTELAFVCADQRSNAHDVLAGTVGHDIVLVPPVAGSTALARLYLVDDRGDQAFEFEVFEDGAELVPSYHPLRLFSGKGLVSEGAVASYDLGERWYPIPLRPVDRFASDAVVTLAPELPNGRGFDAGAPRTVWHRLVLDAVIPPGCTIDVESRTADDLTVLEHQSWQGEPSSYLRGDGSEIPFHTYPDAAPCPGQGSWELLFQRAVGRYAQLRLRLRGDGRRTPRLWALRVHAPRYSYLEQYLPDIYREDRESASFLDRYLANVEGMYTTFEGRITNAQRVLDPATIDAEFLPWLASWMGATVEPDWDDARSRLFVRHAARMFARRGTQRGMIEAIRLATHPCPTDEIFDDAATEAFDVRIVEAFRTRSVPGVVFGDPNDLAGPRLNSSTPRWELNDGGSQLTARWRGFLSDRYPTPAGTTLSDAVASGWGVPTSVVGTPPVFPVLTPGGSGAADWYAFVRSELVVTYADVGSDGDLAAYRSFLEQRYRRIDDYRSAWNLTSGGPTDFSTLPFPVSLPADGAPLQDWIMFVSSVLPARRAAHRATVLVPIRLEDSDEQRLLRLGQVQRVVDVERPAHTVVDVQPYWAALRVGEARVGFETIVGEGGRYVDLVLGSGRLAHAAIPGGQTWRLDDRVVVGRDRIERSAVEPTRTGGF